LDFDVKGHLVGIDIDRASEVANLSRLEATALPVRDLHFSGAQA